MTNEATPQNDSDLPEETTPNPENAAPLPPLPITEHVAVPAVEAIAPDVVPAVEAIAPDVVPAVEAVLPDVVPAVEAIAPDAVPAVEAIVPDAVPAVEAIVPDAVPAVEAIVPDAVPAVEAIVPDAVPAVELVHETPADQAGEEERKDDGKRRPKRKAKLSDEEAAPIWDELRAAKEAADILPMTCTRSIPGGAIVEFKGLEGFIPRSQFLAEGRAEQTDMESCVGQELGVVVIEVSELGARKFVCSRKKALKREQFKNIKKGDVMEGTVTSITSYGVFVDLGGIDGLIHVSRLSKVRVATPSEAVKVNERVKVRVVEVDPKSERIALSMKEFTESPWQHVIERYSQGSMQKGRIRNITDFGVYVQLEPGVVGMIHISDLSWTRRLQHPSEMVKTGQEITVKVLDVKAADKRIALSLKDTQPDPWPRLGNIYPAGTEATGTVKRVMDAGAIVSLDYEVDCFVPRGKMGARRGAGGRGKVGRPEPIALSVGDAVRVKVIEMDVDKHSFIAAIMREEDHDQRSGEQKDGYGSAHNASERAFTLGELAGLQSLFPSTPDVVETAPIPAGDVSAEVVPVEAEVVPVEAEAVPAEAEAVPAEAVPAIPQEEAPAAVPEPPAAVAEDLDTAANTVAEAAEAIADVVPETTEPETAEPETAEPETAEPETAEPETAEPDTAGAAAEQEDGAQA